MKFTLLFVLACCFAQQVFSRNYVAIAASQLVKKVFVERSELFDIYIGGNKTQKLNEIATKIMKMNESPVKLFHVDSVENRLVNRSAVLLFDTFVSYQDFHQEVEVGDEFTTKFNFLVIVTEDLDIFSFTNMMTVQETFLVESDKTVALTTHITFQQPNCQKWVGVELNEFSKASRKWKTDKFSIEKFKNLNGCQIGVGVLFSNRPVSYYELDKAANKYIFKGYGIDFLRDFASYFNFTFKCNYYDDDGKSLNNEINVEQILIFSWSIRAVHTLYSKRLLSPTFTTSDDIFVVSRNLPYTQYEKMFLPFELEVWICLLVTFSIGTIVIFVLKLFKKSTQYFVFGMRVNTPFMNFM